ncbi:MAG: hydrogenase small subunit [Sedimentisphaerales bacterium]|nr:hydrogenase small subunit [Sedimentisphaerales bacterium]
METRHFTRREFMKVGTILAAGLSLPVGAARLFAAGLEKLVKTTRVVWIQGQSCSGCSVSLLNSMDPEPVDLLTQIVSLVLHQTIGAAQGETFMQTLNRVAQEGDYILVVEGSIPLEMPQACVIGGRTLEEILVQLIPKSKYVIAVGTCAAFGGIPAAEGNHTHAGSVRKFMEKHHFSVKNCLVNCPSCPAHPKSVVGTLAYLAGHGYPDVVPETLTPRMFYGHSTHDECPRYHYYERKLFAKYLGDPEGCLFKLGCLGPITYTRCPHRQWNNGVNWCIRASAPCIGCSSPYFAQRKDFPFYRKGELQHAVNYTENERKGEK